VTGRGPFALAVEQLNRQREHDEQSGTYNASFYHEDDYLPRRQARKKRFHHSGSNQKFYSINRHTTGVGWNIFLIINLRSI